MRRTGRARWGLVAAVTSSALLAACASSSVAGPSTVPTQQPTSESPSASSSPTLTASPSSAHSASATPRPTKSATHPPPVVPVGGAYVTSVPIPKGCFTVGPAIVGVKVYLVQKALHLVGHGEVYDAATAAAVRAFQGAHALPVTGLVDSRTWTALGTGYPFCIDQYTQQPVVARGASASTRIEAMIAYATHRVGTPYMWGGAGPIGYDCSGMVIQAMYAGGRVVAGLTTDRHIQADFATTNYLYASRLMRVPLSQRRRGDLVFFGSSLTHMAIYLGNGQIVEAVRPVIRIASLYADGLLIQPYVLRPFPS
jgi:cell wall-associated NlpC family hydrolase